MDSLSRCRECRALFLEADPEYSDGHILQFCPRCGEYEDMIDEVPEHFELAWYWEIISAGFSVRERVVLKTIADGRMNFPS